MVKTVKTTKQETNKAELPAITNEIFKMKIDRETQKFFIDGLEAYGQFSELMLRPLDMFTKIVAYNDDFEVTKESTLYRELKEARDSTGATATDKPIAKICGRIIWKNQTENLSDEEKKTNAAKAKFYILLFGVASIEGKAPLMVELRVGGSKFMEVIQLLKKIKEDKTEYNRAEVKITAHESTEFDWPELEFTTDFTRELPVAGLDTLFDTIEEYVEYHNQGIDKKARFYQDKKSGKSTGFKKTTSFKRK